MSKPPSGLGVALVVKHNQTIHNPTSKLVCQSFLLWHSDYLSAAATLFSTVSFRTNKISCPQLRLIFLSLTLRVPDPHPTGGTASPWFQLKDTYQLKDTSFINLKIPRLSTQSHLVYQFKDSSFINSKSPRLSTQSHLVYQLKDTSFINWRTPRLWTERHLVRQLIDTPFVNSNTPPLTLQDCSPNPWYFKHHMLHFISTLFSIESCPIFWSLT